MSISASLHTQAGSRSAAATAHASSQRISICQYQDTRKPAHPGRQQVSCRHCTCFKLVFQREPISGSQPAWTPRQAAGQLQLAHALIQRLSGGVQETSSLPGMSTHRSIKHVHFIKAGQTVGSAHGDSKIALVSPYPWLSCQLPESWLQLLRQLLLQLPCSHPLGQASSKEMH